ncbi:MAG: efflux RND transporter permease subunit [Gemmataceae bacterium]
MNPIVFALRRPVTIIVAMIALAAGGAFALTRMKVDIFPNLDLPVIYVSQPYGGMDPAQMEGLLTNYYEYHFLYIGGIHHVESKNVQGVALMKLVFHPGTDMAQAMAETVGQVDRSRAFMPPGTVPPFIMRFDTGSVPVGYLVLSSETKTVDQIQDDALFKVRPMFAKIPGVSAPPPFGGMQKTVVIRANPDRLRAYNLSADDVVQSLVAGNAISPSGNVRIQEQIPLVPVNSMAVRPADFGAIPIGRDKKVFLRDIAPVIEVAADIPTGYALVNGKRAVYILATKRAEASTTAVVDAIRANLPRMRAVLPPDIHVSFEFDQSPYVTGAIENVAVESALGAFLTGLMVLVFLRDWRSVIVVIVNIPLALISSVIALALTGQTINLMTLGGLALAVGILVDESTVAVENIHTHLDRGDSLGEAVIKANDETMIPRLLAMLCVLAVFIPSFLMQGAARALFVPLSLAVGFAMIASYLLSSTLVPVLSVLVLRHAGAPHESTHPLGRLAGKFFGAIISARWVVGPAYLAAMLAIVLVVGFRLGTEIFPQVDAGQFQVRIRAPAGTRIEQTEAIAEETLAAIGREIGADKIATSVGYVGAVPAGYAVNNVYLWMSGPQESVLRIALKKDAARIEAVKRRLRESLPSHLQSWLAQKWRDEGIPASRVEQEVSQLRLSFEPADIVNEVMSFGSTTPIEVIVSGPKLADNRAHAAKVFANLQKIPALCDLQYGQSLDYPTVEVTVNREQAAFSGVTAQEVAKSLVAATSSSRFTLPNFWRDPNSGIGYQVQVEIPQSLMKSVADIEAVPIKQVDGEIRLLRDVAQVHRGTMPGELDRYNMMRLVSMTANIEGEDLGRVSAQVARAVADAGKPPAGVDVDVRGQVEPLGELFRSLRLGLGMAVVVILLMLTAYYQSPRLALVSIATVPAVLAGITLSLWATRSTLNLQSFMGSIMAVGVSVANAILLVTFAERKRQSGLDTKAAASAGAMGRIRPVLMTSAAMVAGMVPMALGWGEGGDQTAPLGRAVIGGLVASTAATLLVLPAVYALVMGSRRPQPVSLYAPDLEQRGDNVEE